MPPQEGERFGTRRRCQSAAVAHATAGPASGILWPPRHRQAVSFFYKVQLQHVWPCFTSAIEHLRPRAGGVPTGVNLLTFLMKGPLTWPGQHAGFLGPRFDPWQITRDPNAAGFGVDSL